MKTLQLASLLRLEEDNMNFPGYGVSSYKSNFYDTGTITKKSLMAKGR